MKHVFVGYDPRDDNAFKVCYRSIERQTMEHGHTVQPIMVHPLKEWELRAEGLFYRTYRVEPNGQMIDQDGRPFSTQFSFTRFLTPFVAAKMGITEPVLFMDADMMVRTDLTKLWDLWEDDKSLMCVQHNQVVGDNETKMDGVIQSPNSHGRKNWSSLMLMHPKKCQRDERFEKRGLNLYGVNNMSGAALHGLSWIDDDQIGRLPETWNYLVGYSDPDKVPDPHVVHHTLGTPDMVGPCEYDDEWWAYLGGQPEDIALSA